jgi:hypothetical protein
MDREAAKEIGSLSGQTEDNRTSKRIPDHMGRTMVKLLN